MPHRNFDPSDSDPLLGFSIERGEAAPTKADSPETVQPVDDAAVAAASQVEPAPIDPLDPIRARIDALQDALDRSTTEVAKLTSRVATLVSASRDIDRRVPPSFSVKPAPAKVRSWSPFATASALAGVVFGIAVAWFWMQASNVEMDPVVAIAPERLPVPLAAPLVPAATNDEPRNLPRIEYVGTLSIDAAPGGEVFINRQDAGHTPLRVEKLRAGSHLVWIERDGYRRWTGVVPVPADRVSRVFADLERIVPP